MFDVGRTLPNTDRFESRFYGTSRGWVDGSWDAHLASPAVFFAGSDHITKRERAWDRDWPGTSNALSNLRLLLLVVPGLSKEKII